MDFQWCMNVSLCFVLIQTLCTGRKSWNNNQAPINVSGRNSGNGTTYHVEVLAVLDFSIFNYYFKETNGTGRIAKVTRIINQHVTQRFKEIDARFESMRKKNLDIHIRLSDICIIQKLEHSIWLTEDVNEKLDASSALSSFQKWIMTSRKLELFDHAMLFTRQDITHNDAEEIAGLAYVERMCSTHSVSIVEDLNNPVLSTIAAHELAHSLGALHDGSANSCPSSSNFIMSDTSKITGDVLKNKNSWQFSSCSVNYTQLFISSLQRQDNNCLAKRRATTEDAFITLSDSEAATVTSPDDQCRKLEGEHSSLCRILYKGNYSDFCALMMCRLDEKSCSYSIPSDGTVCGHNQVCQFGYCVTQEIEFQSSPYNESCPFGDQPGVVSILGNTCKKTISDQPYLCYDVTISHTCCESCGKQYKKNPDCEYGNKDTCQSITMFTCLLDTVTCCDSCKGTSRTGLLVVFILGVIVVTMMLASLYLVKQRYCEPKTDTTASSTTVQTPVCINIENQVHDADTTSRVNSTVHTGEITCK